MADVPDRLPSRIEASAQKRRFYSTEIVRTDGGLQHTNQRWAEPMAEWDIEVPLIKRNSQEYLAVEAVFEAAKGSMYTFDFHDVETCEIVEVRIKEDTIVINGVGNLVTIAMTLEKARG
jgi:uncharacterized protein (TIGR02217 family)